MGETTGISWTDHTFNPWRGCTKVAPECHSCYADQLAKRNPKTLGIWGPNGTRVMGAPAYWKEPIKWNREAEKAGERRRVFCASLADVFEDWRGVIHDHRGTQVFIDGDRFTTDGLLDEYPHALPSASMCDLRAKLFALIDDTPHLNWLLLTKRPENVRRMWPAYTYHACVTGDCPHDRQSDCDKADTHYRDNVWLGTSAGTQATANKAIPHLLACRDLAPVLFVSCEPMLDAVDFSPFLWNWESFPGATGTLDWAIFGVESNGKRVGRLGSFLCEGAWESHARTLVGQCRSAGVAPFVKQIPMNGVVSHDLAEWMPSLRVQEFPEVPHAV